MNIQRLMLTILSVALLGLVFTLMVQNWETAVSIRFFSATFSSVSLGSLLGLSGLATGLAILLKAGERLLLLNVRQQRTSRALERQDVAAEGAEARVKVLEAQVQTLEQALHSALHRESS